MLSSEQEFRIARNFEHPHQTSPRAIGGVGAPGRDGIRAGCFDRDPLDQPASFIGFTQRSHSPLVIIWLDFTGQGLQGWHGFPAFWPPQAAANGGGMLC